MKRYNYKLWLVLVALLVTTFSVNSFALFYDPVYTPSTSTVKVTVKATPTPTPTPKVTQAAATTTATTTTATATTATTTATAGTTSTASGATMAVPTVDYTTPVDPIDPLGLVDIAAQLELVANTEMYNTGITNYFETYRETFAANYKIANRMLTPDDIENIVKGASISNLTVPFEETFSETIARVNTALVNEGTSDFVTDSFKKLNSIDTFSTLYRLEGDVYKPAILEDVINPRTNSVSSLYTKVSVQSSGTGDSFEYIESVDLSSASTLFYLDLILNKATDSSSSFYYRESLLTIINNLTADISMDVFGNVILKDSKIVVFPVCYNDLIFGGGTGAVKVGTVAFAKEYGNVETPIFVDSETTFNFSTSDYKVSADILRASGSKNVADYTPFNILDLKDNLKASKSSGLYIMKSSSDEDAFGKYSLTLAAPNTTDFYELCQGTGNVNKNLFTFSDMPVEATPTYRICYYGDLAVGKFFTPSISAGPNNDETVTNLYLSEAKLNVKIGSDNIFTEKEFKINTKLGDDESEVKVKYLVPTNDVFLSLSLDGTVTGNMTRIITALMTINSAYSGYVDGSAAVSTPITYPTDIFVGGKTITGTELPTYNYANLTYEFLQTKTKTETAAKCPVKFNALQGPTALSAVKIKQDVFLNLIYNDRSSQYYSGGVASSADVEEAKISEKAKVTSVLDSLYGLVTDPAGTLLNVYKSSVSAMHVNVNKANAIGLFLSSKDTVLSSEIYWAIIRVYVFSVIIFMILSVFVIAIRTFSNVGETFVADMKATALFGVIYILPIAIFISYLSVTDFVSTSMYNKTLTHWGMIDSEIAVRSKTDNTGTSSADTQNYYFLKYSEGLDNSGVAYGSSIPYHYYNNDGDIVTGSIYLRGSMSTQSPDGGSDVTYIYKEDINAINTDFEFMTPNIDLYSKSLYFYFYDNFADQMKKYYSDASLNAIDNEECKLYRSQGKFFQMLVDDTYANADYDGNVQDILGFGRLLYRDPRVTNNLIDYVDESAWYALLDDSTFVRRESIRDMDNFRSNIDSENYPNGVIYGSLVNAVASTGDKYIQLSMLEEKLNAINKETYKSLVKLCSTKNVSDETMLRIASAEALFQFNKAFSSVMPWGSKIEPVSYSTDLVNVDTVIRGSIASQVSDMKFTTNIVQFVDERGTIVSVFLLPLLDAVILIATYCTHLALFAMLITSLVNFIYSYGIKRNLAVRSYIGMFGCFLALFVARILCVTIFNALCDGVSIFAGEKASRMNSISAMLTMLLTFLIYAIINIFLCWFMMKNWKDLGYASGKMFVNKLKATFTGMQGKVSGMSASAANIYASADKAIRSSMRSETDQLKTDEERELENLKGSFSDTDANGDDDEIETGDV